MINQIPASDRVAGRIASNRAGNGQMQSAKTMSAARRSRSARTAGVDVRLLFGDPSIPMGVVQCRAWGRRQVGVAPVCERLVVWAQKFVKGGYFAATGDFNG